MKSKYRERLTQGLAIGAVLALNGCTDPVKIAKDTMHTTEAKVAEVKSVVKTRLELNTCLQKVHPERGVNFELIAKDADLLMFDSVNTVYCDSDHSRHLVVELDGCRIFYVSLKAFICTDDNSDGKWENIVSYAPEYPSLSSTDEKGNPKKWKRGQDMCNSAFNKCLDWQSK